MKINLSSALVAAVLLAAATASGRPREGATAPADAFTPVVARVVTPPAVFVRGSDGRYHAAYDLELQNARLAPATLTKVDVLDAERPSRVLATIAGDELVGRLRTLAARPVADAGLAPDAGRVLFVELALASPSEAPRALLHRLTLLGAANPAATEPSPLEYTAAPYAVAGGPPAAVGPPLRGAGWVAMNGCCAPGFPHRSSFLPVNGAITNGQRFAIDWMRLDARGRLVVGDTTKPENWTGYGAEVLAVADATVVDTLDALDDNVPGALPDPKTITLQTVDGNHVVLDLGGGHFAFYAHLERGSVRVRPGDRVKRGDVIGLLGNTGNSSAPHLHFHVMDGRSVLGSQGVPYHFDRFAFAGLLPLDVFERSTTLTEDFGAGRREAPERRAGEYPLAWTIVDFPEKGEHE